MKNMLADFATDIAHCKNDASAWHVGQSFFKSLGFETVNYGLMYRQNGAFLGFYTTMNDDWMAYYTNNRYDNDDPLTAHCMRYNHAVHYSFDGRSQLALSGGKLEMKMLGDFYEAGIHSSYLVPFHNDLFAVTGGINLAARISSEECEKLVEKNRQEILVASALLNSHLAGLPQSVKRSKAWINIQSNAEGITPREMEVLKWLSVGLRNDRVAERMHVTPATINFHIGSIKKKLGAQTREQALVIAMRKGIVAL